METTSKLCAHCIDQCRKKQLETEKAALHAEYKVNQSQVTQNQIIEKQKEIRAVRGACTQTRGQSA